MRRANMWPIGWLQSRGKAKLKGERVSATRLVFVFLVVVDVAFAFGRSTAAALEFVGSTCSSANGVTFTRIEIAFAFVPYQQA